MSLTFRNPSAGKAHASPRQGAGDLVQDDLRYATVKLPELCRCCNIRGVKVLLALEACLGTLVQSDRTHSLLCCMMTFLRLSSIELGL